ncbi:MAG: WD40 repeat domain-containing protein, partial [Gemmataceae bacterium]|nr:WD40 repeat domain-containing protein [Gemmataceae bacterium]
MHLALLLLAHAGPVPAPDFDRLPAGALSRLGSPRLRHGGVVRALAFSPDGTRLASASHDRTVSVWHVPSGRELLRLRGHEGDATSLAWLSDSRLASGSADGSVRLWSLDRRASAVAIPLSDDGVLCLAASPDGKTLAAGCDDGSMRLLDAATGKAMGKIDHDRAVVSLAWSADGKRLAAGIGSKGISLKDADGKETKAFGTVAPTALAFSGVGAFLAALEPGDTVRVWDMAKGKEAKSWRPHAESAEGLCYGLAWTSAGILSGDSRGKASMRDAAGKESFALDGHRGRTTAVAVSRAGVLATAGADGTIRLWDGKTGKALTEAGTPAEP